MHVQKLFMVVFTVILSRAVSGFLRDVKSASGQEKKGHKLVDDFKMVPLYLVGGWFLTRAAMLPYVDMLEKFCGVLFLCL